MTPVVKTKPGVRFATIAPAGFRILAAVQCACERLKRDLTITCGTEDHSPLDPHTLGEAYDLSVGGLKEDDIRALHNSLSQQLGPAFTVLYEVPAPVAGKLASLAYVNAAASGPHLHVQRRKMTVYPAPEGLQV